MDQVPAILTWLEMSPLGQFTRNVEWAFGAFETMHFIGLCLLYGAMLIVDLRLMGVLRQGSIRGVLAFTHVAIFGFCLNLISGIAFISSAPSNYWFNPLFKIKMVLIVIAALNVVWFEAVERRKVLALAEGVKTGPDTKLVAALSLALWTAIIIIGRFFPTLSPT